MFCHNCGAEMSEGAAVCIKCGHASAVAKSPAAGSTSGLPRYVYVLLGIFIPGIHNVVAGYVGKGVAQLILSFFFVGWVWSVIDACIVTEDAKGNAFS